MNQINKKFYTDFDLKGNSNYAFPLVLKEKSIKQRNNLEKIMKKMASLEEKCRWW